MDYTAKNIATYLGLETKSLAHPEVQIQQVQLDSRIISNGQKTLFVALQSDNGDGHRFLKSAYEKGVRNFLISESVDSSFFAEANFFEVADTKKALQDLAIKHRAKFNIPVIGVTGSNGKTIVKEWISFLLNNKFFVHKSPGSFNSQIGVPLSIFPLSPHHELAVFEAGISLPGEMEKLNQIIQSSIGVFTHLGSAHDIGFNNRREKMLEKSKLFSTAEAVIFPADDSTVVEILAPLKAKKLSWSWEKKDVFCQVLGHSKKFDGTELILKIDNNQLTIWVPFISKAQVENAISAVITAHYCGLSFKQITQAVANLPEVDMRLTLSKGIHNSTLVNDYYNADLHGLDVALDFMNVHAHERKKILILSELNQVALKIEALFEIIKKAKDQHKIDEFIGIGPAWQKVLSSAESSWSSSFENSAVFLNQFKLKTLAESIVLLKGSRQFKFEKLSQALRFQAHSAQLSINLSSLKSNLDFFRQQLSKDTKLMVMVKASAYGSGSPEVSRVLAYNQVDALCVAYIDEGIELRRQGILLPIMVLNADPGSFSRMAQYDLDPEIYKNDQLLTLSQMDQPPGIHLKLDTGMNRLGFKPEALPAIASLLQQPKLKVISVFSHLAASDSATEDQFTHQQATNFISAADKVDQILGYSPLRHIVNTQGILRFPQYHFDQVRLGIGLYGLGIPTPWKSAVQSIFNCSAAISQIKTLKPGETIGYGRQMKVESPIHIATVNFGYADGLLRKAGNGRFALKVNGKFAPTVGNICMDMCMIDITDIPDVKEGQLVEIFSDTESIERLANCLETIPYEVLTNISSRIPRIYLRD